ncbi:MAG: triose-phosphate isomerase, partial [Oscillospiraceae bacterium]
EQNITFEVVGLQTKVALQDVKEEELDRIIIAYEPVWAIGTGKTATSEQANEVCKFIRDLIADLYNKDSADKLVVQYGGSMNAANADELLAQPDVDGGLIGGASLKSADFAKIVNAASK